MTRRACQNKTRRQIQRLIEARLLKRRGFFITVKNPRIAAGIYWKLSLPTQLNPTNLTLARRLCG